MMTAGDVVRLKGDSSYPPMTVRYAETYKIICVWFDKLESGEWGALQQAEFNNDMLIQLDADELD